MDLVLSERLFDVAERLPEFSLLLAFIAPFVGGEVATMTLGFFAGQGTFPLINIIFGSFLGMMTLDSFWFLIMRSPLTRGVRNRIKISDKYKKMESKIEKISSKNDIAILLISKILIGTRILVLAYISVRKLSFKKFLAFDGSATLVWAITLGYLGWFAGLGYYALAAAKYGLTVAGLYIIFATIIIYSVFYTVRRKVEAKG